ncbi:hypothetical protein PVAP13_6KG025935 [Panicum virgatum]|uniref:Uncharacterized protein n=1 Tax=Panicum virgatum TaxID=38727 RepID=A0A8T0R6P9_PANVG|nr:hypothetical protein PVAP13_6KG025935 [Panicum virgatum]
MTSCILMIVYRYDSLLCSFSKCIPSLCSQGLESATATKGKSAKSESAGSERSSSGSNQHNPIPVCSEQTIVPLNAKAKKKRKQPAKKQGKKSYALI